MDRFDEYKRRKTKEYGDKFDTSDLNPSFIPYFRTGQRVEVEFDYGKVVRGFIGVTTGWKPVFLLLRTRRSISSFYTISQGDKVVRVITRY